MKQTKKRSLRGKRLQFDSAVEINERVEGGVRPGVCLRPMEISESSKTGRVEPFNCLMFRKSRRRAHQAL